MADHFYALNRGQTTVDVVVGTSTNGNPGIEVRIRDNVPITKREAVQLLQWIESYLTTTNELA